MDETDIIMTFHAWQESEEDGISVTEIADAIKRGHKHRQNGKYIVIYKYFTVVYKVKANGMYKIITVYSGYPR
jgi:hypothetical protein